MRIHVFHTLLVGWSFLLLAAAIPSHNIYSLTTFGHPLQLPFGALFAPKPVDFWDAAKQLSEKVKIYIETKLNEAATNIPLAATKITEFKEAVANAVTASNKLREDIETGVKEHLTLDQISHILSEEFDLIFQELQGEFPEELPEDIDSRHAERVRIVSWVMDKVENSLVKVTGLWGISEPHTRMRFQEIKLHVTNVVLVAGHIADTHPVLTEMIIFSGAVMLMPSSLILRPFLGLFGFGPYGPVKGSMAAWAQRRFFGGFVSSGSWFSMLQAAGMLNAGFWVKLWARILVMLGITAGISSVVKGIAH